MPEKLKREKIKSRERKPGFFATRPSRPKDCQRLPL